MAFLLILKATLHYSSIAAARNQVRIADHTLDEKQFDEVKALVEKARLMRRFKPLLQRALEPKSSYVYGIKQGDIIQNRYEVKEILDSGATGNVHKVLDSHTGETFVIKSLREGVHKNNFIRRFIREASTLSILNHPNVVSIEDMGWDENRPFIILEYLSGGNFKTLMESFHAGKVELNTMLHHAADICDGLEELHSRKIIHRDLKPSNVMVSNEVTRDNYPNRPKIKITDFGLVRLNSQDINFSTVSFLTNSDNQPFGTPIYSAVPDLFNDSREIDERADLYSLGIFIYEMIMKKLPFSADDFFTLREQHLNEKPDFSTIPMNVPARLISLIDKLLAKHPDDRYQTAREVACELRSIATPKTISVGLAELVASRAM